MNDVTWKVKRQMVEDELIKIVPKRIPQIIEEIFYFIEGIKDLEIIHQEYIQTYGADAAIQELQDRRYDRIKYLGHYLYLFQVIFNHDGLIELVFTENECELYHHLFH